MCRCLGGGGGGGGPETCRALGQGTARPRDGRCAGRPHYVRDAARGRGCALELRRLCAHCTSPVCQGHLGFVWPTGGGSLKWGRDPPPLHHLPLRTHQAIRADGDPPQASPALSQSTWICLVSSGEMRHPSYDGASCALLLDFSEPRGHWLEVRRRGPLGLWAATKLAASVC